jgi:hypothetical protein
MELDRGMIASPMWYAQEVLDLAQLPPPAVVADPPGYLKQSFLEHEMFARGNDWVCRPDAFAVHEEGNRLQLFEFKTMEFEPLPGTEVFEEIVDKLKSSVAIVSQAIHIGFDSADGYLLWSHDGTCCSVRKIKLK